MRTAFLHYSAGAALLLAASACLAQGGFSRSGPVADRSDPASAAYVTTTVTDSAAAEDFDGSPSGNAAAESSDSRTFGNAAMLPMSAAKIPLKAQRDTAGLRWEFGPFAAYGFGTGNRSEYKFFNVGLHAGRVLTPPAGPGILRGQFEYGGELMPFWQAYTPAPHLQTVTFKSGGVTHVITVPYGGGTFTGASITPVILRWNLSGTASRRVLPWIQGAGGLIWTSHKFPPDYLPPHGQPGGTSVINFTPQFGIGMHYFVRREGLQGRSRKGSIDFSANAIHISSSSLGDRNPGVNASVHFQLGYSWWK